MDDDQWETVCLHLDQGWKGEMTEDRAGVYATFLKALSFESAMEALTALALQGQPWLPTVPELVAAVRRVGAAALPAWSEVWDQIVVCMKRGRIVEGTHPTVAAFIEVEKLKRLQQAPFFDPDRGDMRVHQLRTRFEEFVDVAEAREQQRLVIGVERAADLERGVLPQIGPA